MSAIGCITWCVGGCECFSQSQYTPNKYTILLLTWELIVVRVFIKFTVQTLNAQLPERFTDHQRVNSDIWLNFGALLPINLPFSIYLDHMNYLKSSLCWCIMIEKYVTIILVFSEFWTSFGFDQLWTLPTPMFWLNLSNSWTIIHQSNMFMSGP